MVDWERESERYGWLQIFRLLVLLIDCHLGHRNQSEASSADTDIYVATHIDYPIAGATR